MIMYKVTSWSNKVEPVEILKKTDKTVTTKHGRENIKSNYSYFFDTHIDAKNHVINKLKSQIDNMKQRLSMVEQQLSNAEKEL